MLVERSPTDHPQPTLGPHTPMLSRKATLRETAVCRVHFFKEGSDLRSEESESHHWPPLTSLGKPEIKQPGHQLKTSKWQRIS